MPQFHYKGCGERHLGQNFEVLSQENFVRFDSIIPTSCVFDQIKLDLTGFALRVFQTKLSKLLMTNFTKTSDFEKKTKKNSAKR